MFKEGKARKHCFKSTFKISSMFVEGDDKREENRAIGEEAGKRKGREKEKKRKRKGKEQKYLFRIFGAAQKHFTIKYLNL